MCHHAARLFAGLERTTDVVVGVATGAALALGGRRVLQGLMPLGDLAVAAVNALDPDLGAAAAVLAVRLAAQPVPDPDRLVGRWPEGRPGVTTIGTAQFERRIG